MTILVARFGDSLPTTIKDDRHVHKKKVYITLLLIAYIKALCIETFITA